MNIFNHEFKSYSKSVAIWSGSIFLIILVYLSAMASISVDIQTFNDILASFPEEFLIAFGMTELDLSSIVGMYGLVFLFCQICLAIQAANYGFSLISIEERELTADFLLAKPIGRGKILTAKLLAAIASLTITNLTVWVSSFLIINLNNDGQSYETKPVILLLLSIVVFQLFFLSVGVLISLLMKRVRSVTPLSMALAFGMYVLSAFGGMLGEDTIELISPFKHFEPNYIIKNVAYDTPLVLISVITILIAIPASYLLFSKRNIHSAV
ncbi:MAG: ABC transporter permease subunit [Anaerolineales bacterium]|nr:ABC transporter permease subunit [Anaerolineales bacterium]